jgi:hypothetical protein
LKFSRNSLRIPNLSETATDQEIRAAWDSLCKIQEKLQEKQKNVARTSKILYDKNVFLKKKAISPKTDIESCEEAVVEEKSRSLMKSLSQEANNLVSDPALLTEVDRWRSR